MKKTILTILLVFSLIFTSTAKVYSLTYPDPGHPPFGSSNVDPLMPSDTFEGSYMFSNIFTVPIGGTTISFDYNFLTEDSFENDYFAAALLNSSFQLIEFYNIADVSSSSFTSLTVGTGPHGSNFTRETGVRSGSINITSTYEGTDTIFALGVFDVQNNSYDSGVLIDNVSLPVPNGDFSNGLIGAGGFIIQTVGVDRYGGNVHLLPDSSLSGVDTSGFANNYAYLSTGPGPMVPEPVSSILFIIGGATLGFRRFWKKRRTA